MVEIGKESQKVAKVAPIFKNPLPGGGFLRAPAGAPSFAILFLANENFF
jgi:hypothetical protein